MNVKKISFVSFAVLILLGLLPGNAKASGNSFSGLTGINQVTLYTNSTTGILNSNLIGADGPGPYGHYPIAQMRAIGLKFVRLDVGFEDVYHGNPVYNCQNGQWNPSYFNQAVSAVKKEGATPLAIVDYTPDCLANSASGNLNYALPDKSGWTKWDDLVYQMALKEIPNGVKIYEIWNEPDGIFFTGGVKGYLELYSNSVNALEAAAKKLNSQIMVGGPGLSWWDPGWMQPFLKYVADNNLALNFVSWHWYADDPDVGPFPPDILNGLCLFKTPLINGAKAPCYYNPNLSAQIYNSEVGFVRSYLKPYPNLHPILWIDEWNANAGFDERMNTSYDAAFSAAVLSSVSAQNNLRMCFYNEVDTPNDPDGNWGMVSYPAEKPKPVYWSFYFWHLMQGKMLKVYIKDQSPSYNLTTPNSGSIKVNSQVAVTATKSGKNYFVELTNFEPYDPTGNYGANKALYSQFVTINLKDLPNSSYGIYEQKVTYSTVVPKFKYLGSLNSTSAKIKVDLPSESVYLLKLVLEKTSSDQAIVIASSLVGFVVILALILVAVIIIRRARR